MIWFMLLRWTPFPAEFIKGTHIGEGAWAFRTDNTGLGLR